MVTAAAAAGATGTWVDARKALLDTVFETHPKLDKADLEKYLAVRGLVSFNYGPPLKELVTYYIQRIDAGNDQARWIGGGSERRRFNDSDSKGWGTHVPFSRTPSVRWCEKGWSRVVVIVQ